MSILICPQNLQFIASVLQRHKQVQNSKPPLADELIMALLEENGRLYAKVNSLQTKQVTPKPQPIEEFIAELDAGELRAIKADLQKVRAENRKRAEQGQSDQEALNRVRQEIETLYTAYFQENPDPSFRAECTPPTPVTPRELTGSLFQKLATAIQQLDRAEAETTYYQELPNKLQGLQETLGHARAGRWGEALPNDDRFAALVHQKRADSLAKKLAASRQTIAAQKVTIAEQNATITRLQKEVQALRREQREAQIPAYERAVLYSFD